MRVHERPPTTLTLVAIASGLLGAAAVALMLIGFLAS